MIGWTIWSTNSRPVFFWSGTTWTHILTWISEKTYFYYVSTYLCNWFILSACFKCCLIFVLVWLNLFLINKSSRSIFWLWNLFGNVDVVLFWRLLCKVSFTSVESSSSFLNKKVLSESWEFSTKSWIASLMSKGCRSKLPKKYKLKNEDFLSWNKK